MHPNDAEGFEWDDGNVDELAAHHITPYEVEEVFDNLPGWGRNKRSGAGNYKMVGRTDAGRVLTIVILWRENLRLIRPITGWDSTDGERAQLLRS